MAAGPVPVDDRGARSVARSLVDLVAAVCRADDVALLVRDGTSLTPLATVGLDDDEVDDLAARAGAALVPAAAAEVAAAGVGSAGPLPVRPPTSAAGGWFSITDSQRATVGLLVVAGMDTPFTQRQLDTVETVRGMAGWLLVGGEEPADDGRDAGLIGGPPDAATDPGLLSGTADPVGRWSSLDARMARLEQRVDDLEAAGVAGRGRRLQPVATDVAVLVGEVVSTLDLADRRVSIDAAAASGAEVDRAVLADVLRPVLANAVRYTAPGGNIWVEAAVTDDRLRLSIEDDGPGLETSAVRWESDAQWRLEPFATIDPRDPEPRPGLGLGVVASAAQAHGGTLHCATSRRGGLVVHLAVQAPPPPDAVVAPSDVEMHPVVEHDADRTAFAATERTEAGTGVAATASGWSTDCDPS